MIKIDQNISGSFQEDTMRAYKGLVKNGKIVLAEGAELPEGAVVTVTIGETEYLKSKVRASISRGASKIKAKLPVAIVTTLEP
jgi:hypothetical protein